MDAVTDSLVVQQARRDPVNGQTDMVCLRMMSFGTGGIIGAIAGAILI